VKTPTTALGGDKETAFGRINCTKAVFLFSYFSKNKNCLSLAGEDTITVNPKVKYSAVGPGHIKMQQLLQNKFEPAALHPTTVCACLSGRQVFTNRNIVFVLCR